MSDLRSKILATIRRYGMLRPGDRVGVAVSGGADSVSLLHLLDSLRKELGITLLVLHLNHELRGEASDEDERFVASLAEDLHLEMVSRRADVRAYAEKGRLNLEDAGRRLRVEFFGSAARSHHLDRIAVGHTADDQAETVLARLLRGSGMRGLAGIYPVAGRIVRPLIEIRRRELRSYLNALGQSWREDVTNLDTSRLRNRIRHEMLPELERNYNRRIVSLFANLAERARDEEAFWLAVMEWELGRIRRAHRGGIIVELADLLGGGVLGLESREAGRALARRRIRGLLQVVRGDLRRITGAHVEQVLRLAEGPKGSGHLMVPGVLCERLQNRLYLKKNVRAESTERPESFSYPAPLPGTVTIKEIRCCLTLKFIDAKDLGRDYNSGRTVLDADRLAANLLVRSWRPGDYYRPLGARRAKKLKTLFAEKGIPGCERAGWPVLVAGNQIVWARGLPVAETVAVTAETRRVLQIEEESMLEDSPCLP
jgi:tRNA(Ile)-lysidine synthase